MALSATIYNFEIQLADVDRGVYESLAFKVAQHPSETSEYLLTRVIAYCLEYQEGIAFSKGLAEPDEPAVVVRDLTGALRAWIEIGTPDAARLHRASKAAPRVAVYTHRDPRALVRQLSGQRIHRREAIDVHGVDFELLAALAERLERRMKFDLSATGGELYLTLGDRTLTGPVSRHSLAEG
ncbi:MAG: YaeQ family protein [Gemmatimonadaceae bacterium]|nr:YaeQ family protein [Gemmatimonadaceae bacterium]